MSLSLSCFKRLNLKEPILVVFLSSVGSELQFPVTCTSNLESLSSWRSLRLWYVEIDLVPQIFVLLLSPTGLVTLYLIIYGAVLVVYHLKIETNLRNRLLLYSVNSPRVFLIIYYVHYAMYKSLNKVMNSLLDQPVQWTACSWVLSQLWVSTSLPT